MSGLQLPLHDFEGISLSEMDEVKLQNRVDTKYIFGIHQLEPVLKELSRYYRILEIDKKRTNSYRSVYFDTEDCRFYTLHHNGKLNRHKVRIRKYMDTGLCYLEVKFKNNKGRTIKKRKKKPDFELTLSDKSKKFIRKVASISPDQLVPKMWIEFTRLTLVHKTVTERLTIDYKLAFDNEKGEKGFKKLVIAELKQEKFSMNSDFVKVMRQFHIRPMRISKYCLGSAMLDKSLKSNRFKPRFLHINKVTYGAVG